MSPRALGTCVLVALAGCGGSSKNGSPGDGGEDGGAGYGPGDASPGGEGGEGGVGDGSTGDSYQECVPPAAATSMESSPQGPVGCMPDRGAAFSCPTLTTMFKLVCSASTPDNIPPPPSSLNGCNLAPNMTASALYYCCSCM